MVLFIRWGEGGGGRIGMFMFGFGLWGMGGKGFL